MEFLEKLSIMMDEKKINRAELARGASIPYQTIASFYDKGTDNIKLSTLRKLCDYFDCSLDYLIVDDVLDKNYGRNTKTIEVDANTAQIVDKIKLLNADGRRLLSGYIDGLMTNKDYRIARSGELAEHA